jgi:SAM-dependent methyltransferase
LEIFWELHKDLKREGPGNEAATLKALALASCLPERARVLDLGCGPGAQTISLAKAINGNITAMDLHEPFLAQLRQRAEAEGLSARISARKGDMAALDFEPESFDLIWSEGAIYNMGFARGLEEWRRYLKPGGYIAVSELCWLRTDPPEELAAYWAYDYPAMKDKAANLAIIEGLGYELAGHFTLPEECWRDEYYGPLGKRIATLRAAHSSDAEALSALDLCQKEIDLYERYSSYYGYEFFVMREKD